jgi:peptidylprolyl isomerase
VHYDGRLNDGTQFDTSMGGDPASFRLNQVIAGWTEGLQLMTVGDDYLLYIPSDLAYGAFPPPGGPIKAGDDLIFRVQLIDVEKKKVYPATSSDTSAWDKYKTWNPKAPGVQKTASGLQYAILKSGAASGTPATDANDVMLHYEARIAKTGEIIDTTFPIGEPNRMSTAQLFAGWNEAVKLMRPGDRWMLYIPSNLAFGETGTPGGPIPPNTDLQIEVEVMDVIAAPD